MKKASSIKIHRIVKGSHIYAMLKKYYPHIERYEIVESDFSISLCPNIDDLCDGAAKDPFSCPLTLCARRIYQTSIVATFRSIAYMDLPSPYDGVRRVHRFVMPLKTRNFVNAKDKNEQLKDGEIYFFNAVKDNQSIAGRTFHNHLRTPKTVVYAAANAEKAVRAKAVTMEKIKTAIEEAKITERPTSPKIKMLKMRLTDAKARFEELEIKAVQLRTKCTRVLRGKPTRRYRANIRDRMRFSPMAGS